MVKRIIIYIMFLLTIDLFVNLIVNMIQRNPSSLIAASMVLRLFVLAIMLFVVLLIIQYFLKDHTFNLVIIVSSVIVYLSLPLFIYLMKDNQKGILEVYRDLHVNGDLFAIIYIPYIIATLSCLLLFNKLKMF